MAITQYDLGLYIINPRLIQAFVSLFKDGHYLKIVIKMEGIYKVSHAMLS